MRATHSVDADKVVQLVDVKRYKLGYDAFVIKEYGHMNKLLPRMWADGKGELTEAELLWAAHQIDNGYFSANDEKRKALEDWCARPPVALRSKSP